jgi:hypothetical protein
MTTQPDTGLARHVAPAGRRAPRDTSAEASAARSALGERTDVEAVAAPAGAITPDSAGCGEQWPRVRRSKALQETIATDPSPAIEPSAPASTGDMSRPSATEACRQPSVRQLVLGVLSERDRGTLLKGGTPRHEASSSSGPLRPEVLLKRREILVRQYTPAAWRSHVAWHAYWTEHGYDTLNEELRVASPPRPRSDHRTVRLTWGEVRKWVREEHAPLDEVVPQTSSDVSRRPGARTLADDGDTSPATGARQSALRARTRHELDRVAEQLRCRYADRPARRRPGDPKWRWSDPHAQAAERAIRELLADVARGHVLDPRSRVERLLAAARALVDSDPAPDASAISPARRVASVDVAGRACQRPGCDQPIPPNSRPEAVYCSKSCRQKVSRARVKAGPPGPTPVAAQNCGWCDQPMPSGLRPEAIFCSKRCRQASSRFGLGIERATVLLEGLEVAGRPGDTSPDTTAPAVATRRGSSRARSRRDVSPVDAAAPRSRRPQTTGRGSLRLAYADPPYPGKAGLYPEGEEVDHRALVDRLVAEFPNGWALSTSASALQAVLALCPADVRVCSWHRQIRRTRSRRPLSAWEPLIVYGGRELPTNVTQTATDALAYAGRYRTFPGAMTGMKPPQFAVWMFAQLGALPGDELVDLFPGSGAVSRAWERYTRQPGGNVSPGSAARPARHVAEDLDDATAFAPVLALDPDPPDVALAAG